MIIDVLSKDIQCMLKANCAYAYNTGVFFVWLLKKKKEKKKVIRQYDYDRPTSIPFSSVAPETQKMFFKLNNQFYYHQ